MSIKKVAEQQLSSSPVLFGRAYSDVDKNFKILSAKLRGAQVLALGTSRVMNIRSEFFRPEITFYNAGGGAKESGDLVNFLESLPPEKRPKFIILGTDQRWFKPGFKPESTDINQVFVLHRSSTANDPAWEQFFIYGWRKIYLDYFQKKFRLSDVFQNKTDMSQVGLNAIANGNGFRNDGSFYYNDFINNPDKQTILKSSIDEILARIKPGQNNLEYGSELDTKSLQNVEDFLTACKKYHIIVIGYMPPYALVAYQKIQAIDSLDKAVADNLSRTLENLFNHYGFNFYDLSDMKKFGGKDEELIDSQHGSDKTYARIFISLAEQDSVLNDFVDSPKLKEALRLSTDNQQIFGD